jgi:hypothetical protein
MRGDHLTQDIDGTSKQMTAIYLLGTNNSDLPLPDRWLWSFQNFGLRNSQTSNFTSLKIHDIIPHVLLNRWWKITSDDMTIDVYFGSLPSIHSFMPPVLLF